MKLDWPKLALRWKEALGKYKYVLLVIGLGVVLMALPTTGQRDKGQEGAQAPAEGFDLEAFEEKMEPGSFPSGGGWRGPGGTDAGQRRPPDIGPGPGAGSGRGRFLYHSYRGAGLRTAGSSPSPNTGSGVSGGAGGLSRRGRSPNPAEAAGGSVRFDGTGHGPDIHLSGKYLIYIREEST